MTKTIITIKGKSPSYYNGSYSIEVVNRDLIIRRLRKRTKKYSLLEWNRMKKATGNFVVRNLSLRKYIFDKFNLEMNAGGGLFMPRASPRKTFRGMTLNQISAMQRKY